MQLSFAFQPESYKLFRCSDGSQNPGRFESGVQGLCCGRNDFAAVQVLLESDEDWVLALCDHPTLSPPGLLPSVRLTARCGLPVQVQAIGMMADDGGTLQADVLLTQDHIHVKAHETQAVWVECTAATEAQPGRYPLGVLLHQQTGFAPETPLAAHSLDIQVLHQAVPPREPWGYHLDLWQHPANIARKHEAALWSDEHFAILERYVASLAALGQQSVSVIVSDAPWSGQRCMQVQDYPSDLFEYNMVRVSQDGTGKFHYDYGALDRYVQLCLAHGITGEIEIFGLNNIWTDEGGGLGQPAADDVDAIRIRYLDARGAYRYMDAAAQIDDYLRALEAHFASQGWLKQAVLVADEPEDVDRYRAQIARLHRVVPHFRLKCAINHVPFIEAFQDEIEDFVPILPCLAEQWEALQRIRPKIRGRLLWYVCCWPPRPNTFLNSPLTEARLIGILTALWNLDGFLRWNYTIWPEQPRQRLSYRYPDWKAGDTNFVYPGAFGGPLLTLRYKAMLRGAQDFALLRRAGPSAYRQVRQSLQLPDCPADMAAAIEGAAPPPYALEDAPYQAVHAWLLQQE